MRLLKVRAHPLSAKVFWRRTEMSSESSRLRFGRLCCGLIAMGVEGGDESELVMLRAGDPSTRGSQG